MDLQRTAQYIDSILAADQQSSKKESSQKNSPIEKAKGTSLKARFSDPPAPPPQAPLPEKPDVMHRLGSSLDLPNFLRRSDTEKPSSSSVNSSPSQGSSDQSTAAQMASLAEALNAARKEVETQSMRLKEVEDLLVQERVRREDAEERAKRLERERKQREGNQAWLHHPESAPKDDETSTPIDEEEAEGTIAGAPVKDAAPSELRREIEKLKIEVSESKAAAERLKHEKEQAEKERDTERAERQSLAEMIERIRAEEEERVAKERRKEERRKARRSSSTPAVDPTVENVETKVVDTVEDCSGNDEDEEISKDESKKVALQNGHVDGERVKDSPHVHDLGTLISKNAQIYHAAPYLSAVSVVLIGVAVMALVNRMQKGER
jgi:hypothetical protein